MPTASDYIVDQIFPTCEVHIIAGSPGVGKTTFAFQILNDWRQSKPVMGYKSYPCPFVYVSCDRSRRSVITTLKRVNVDKIQFVDARGVSQHGRDAFSAVLTACRRVQPDVRLLFIEAFPLMVPNVSFQDAYKTTGHFLSDLSRTLEREDLTIIGTAHSPKQRENDQIIEPRHLVLGSVAWGAFVETIIAIRRVKPQNPSDMRRQVMLLPRNAREETYDYDLDDDGRFVRVEPTTSFNILNVLVETLPTDIEIPTSDIIELAERAGISCQRTVERWITQAIEEGRLTRVRKGYYRRLSKQ